MSSTILDAWGRPAVSLGGGGGALYSRTADEQRLRPPTAYHFDDYISLLSSGRWKQLISESRAISSRGLVAAAIAQRADYVSGSNWRPYFTGEDADYGEEGEQLLEDTATTCCTRGPRYDWSTYWRLGVLTNSPDGGFFTLLTESDEGWPLQQPLETHRIGQRTSGTQVVKQGDAYTVLRKDDGAKEEIKTPFVGLRIVNGIIYNKFGTEVAYRVLGPTPEEDQDISARDMIHVAPPRWFSEGRPVSQIAPGLLDSLGIDMARSAQLDQQIIDSKMTFVETNDTGKRNPVQEMVNPSITPPTKSGTITEVIERGHIRYVKKGGGSFEAFSSDRPSDQWMNFDMRTAKTMIAAIGWRLEMLDSAALAGGAATRAFEDQINTTISIVFEGLRHAAQRCARHRIAKFTSLGMLRDHPEFLRWNITPPPRFVIDRNSDKVDIENVRAGSDSMPHIHRARGMRSRNVLISQAKYEKMKDEVAKEYGIQSERLGTMSIPGDNLGTGDDGKGGKKPDPANDE